MAASTNKRSVLTGTRSLQNRKRCFANKENVKSVKLFPLFNYFKILTRAYSLITNKITRSLNISFIRKTNDVIIFRLFPL